MLHASDSKSDPEHGVPPYDGAGFVHVLVLSMTPPPQVAEHLDQTDQSAQLPSTEIYYSLFSDCDQ